MKATARRNKQENLSINVLGEDGLNVWVNSYQMQGKQTFTITGTTFDIGGTKLVDLQQFMSRYQVSKSSIHRWIDRAPEKSRHEYCVSVGKKHYVSDRITEMGTADISLLKRKEPTAVDLDPGVIGIDGRIMSCDVPAMQQNNLIPISTVTTDGYATYFDIDLFAARSTMHPNTVRNYIKRLYKCSEIHASERWRYHVNIDRKNYVSPRIFTINNHNRSSLRNIEYSDFFHSFKWDVVGSLHFRFHVTRDGAMAHMKTLYQFLKRRNPGLPLTFLFTTEENAGQDGYHNHFIVGSPRQFPVNKVLDEIHDFVAEVGGNYKWQSLHEPYKECGSFLNYMSKEIHENPDSWGVHL